MEAVEINSSFYRSHRRDTYERWAASVPDTFSFSVKLPREITHDHRLTHTADLDEFFAQVGGLGTKLGVVLVQLPPSLDFDSRVSRRFFAALRARHAGAIVCEPRHASWFTPRADALLSEARIGRVAADPACVQAASEPGGWPGVAYYRLHGSPRVYWSAYENGYLDALTARLRSSDASTMWCVFDNTAAGAAFENALHVVGCLSLADKRR